jgi:mRNA interferase MazF
VRLKRGAMVVASHRDPSGKPRPFLVLRSDHFAAHALVTLLAFTGTCAGIPPLRITVQPTVRNGLQQPSQAMIDHIQSVRIGQIGQVIGELDKADMQAIERAVAVYLGFADRPVAGNG